MLFDPSYANYGPQLNLGPEGTEIVDPAAHQAPIRGCGEDARGEVAGEYGGRYYTHMRNEGDQLLEAIDEALDIGREPRSLRDRYAA